MQTQIRLLLMEQSDQGLHCLPFYNYLSTTLSFSRKDLFKSQDKYDELLCPSIYGKYCTVQNIYTLIKILQSWVFDTTWRLEKLHLIHVRQVFLRTQKLVDLHHQNSISTLNTNYSFSFHIARRSVTEYLLIVKNNKCCRCRIKTLKTGPSHNP